MSVGRRHGRTKKKNIAGSGPTRGLDRGLRGVLAVALAVPLVGLGASTAQAAVGCDALTAEIQQASNPKLLSTLDTPWVSEADGAESRYGFTERHGVAYLGSLSPSGLVPIHRLYHPARADFTLAPRGAAVEALVAEGYRDQGVRFHALPQAGTDCVGVVRYAKGGHTRLAADTATQRELTAAGWVKGDTAFYAAPPAEAHEPPPTTGDSTFSLAVLPDTQAMTSRGDERFGNITSWLVENRSELDLRYVGHSGDVTNWGWLEPSQLDVAVDAMATVEEAGLPYVLTVGNHDTRAVGWNNVEGSTGYGGGAYMYNPECPERLGASQCRSDLLVRQTQEINGVFSADRFRNVGGVFEPNKVDNLWSTFEAGGKKFLVLNIELWPRKAAIEWADDVVASHPEYNVIVQTHHYLEGSGRIGQTNGGYGTTSPQYLWDNLIKKHPNIKMVFSGHTGTAASRTDVGAEGNTVYSFLQNSPGATNPVRLVEIDTEEGTLSSRIYSPDDDRTLTDFTVEYADVDFI
ncbi:metallophosphoesterase [Auraticoccus monumenti]|uniref:Calcineurin-like phosphoesterase n=1 Tax=Auraticoccus monumenti TaxID=675864 RepID=A0A1G6VWA7_9ACTN|nr:metallophosphoesterase [Auraticoccus monumenti]SDD57267.1 Calcineurin-like phosphoesterase [Auraticoccus monumenti]